jgi:uncharacterized protein YceK
LIDLKTGQHASNGCKNIHTTDNTKAIGHATKISKMSQHNDKQQFLVPMMIVDLVVVAVADTVVYSSLIWAFVSQLVVFFLL